MAETASLLQTDKFEFEFWLCCVLIVWIYENHIVSLNFLQKEIKKHGIYGENEKVLHLK